ncbi:MAG: S8 family serine peptidase [Phycisphaerae bacterium]|nr:S8 family serine peptidase [Phycisphaerae bacterium]
MRIHHRRSLSALTGLIVFWCAAGLAVAQGSNKAEPVVAATTEDAGRTTLGSDARSLYLRSGTINLRDKPSLLADGVVFSPDEHYVIQLDGPITPARRAALAACGVRLGEYLPMYAYAARLDDVRAEALMELEFVTWVGKYAAAWKVSPNIGRTRFDTEQRRRVEATGRRRLVVSLFADADAAASTARIKQCGATAVSGDTRVNRRRVEVEIANEHVQKLREIPDVMFVEEAAEGRPRNATTTWICQSNVLDTTPLWDAGLHGEGQMAGIIDWAMREGHCAFADPDDHPIGPTHRKIEAYYGLGATSYAYHGTHVTGVLVGEDLGQTDANLRGMAYEGRVVFQDFNTVMTSTNLNQRLAVAHGHGAQVHNNSWGDDGTADYVAWSRDIDVFTRDNEDDLVLVAVTNADQPVKVPENSKNALAVASTQDTPHQGARCNGGHGPTSDGRQKPEVWAPGCGSISAGTTPCDTHTGSGTSYAAPAVAGMGLLARQYFAEGFYPSGTATPQDAFTPSGALLKAVLVNSAVDMTEMDGYFTANEGWGRILMDDVLFLAGDSRRLVVDDVRNDAGLSTNEVDTYYVTVCSGNEPLKITVVWTDVPATLLAAYTPVNNLDLVVTDPGGVTYLGNVFSGTESATGGTADAVNNVEQVHRHTPATGAWRIDVVAAAVNQDQQGYALVVTGDVGAECEPIPDQLHLVGPIPNAIPVGGEGTITATVESSFAGVPGREVVFAKALGDLTFTAGTISPDGTQATVVTDGSGSAEMTFVADGVGTGMIKAGITGTELPPAFSIFQMVDDGNPPGSPGDLDGDGDLDDDDLRIFCMVLLGTDTNRGHVAAADMNRDGLVDGRDIGALVEAVMGDD